MNSTSTQGVPCCRRERQGHSPVSYPGCLVFAPGGSQSQDIPAFLTPGMSAGALWAGSLLFAKSSHLARPSPCPARPPIPSRIREVTHRCHPHRDPKLPVALGPCGIPTRHFPGEPGHSCTPRQHKNPHLPLLPTCRASPLLWLQVQSFELLSVPQCPRERLLTPLPELLSPPVPPLPPLSPTAPSPRQLQRSPSRRRCRRRDRWCPGRNTCLGLILAPNSHYFTRQPATDPCHPHSSPRGGQKPQSPNPGPSCPRLRPPSPGRR